jgi:hypothetical protein
VGAFSSVGSEHLPYKQGVVGSNPTRPTNEKPDTMYLAFLFLRRLELILKRIIN